MSEYIIFICDLKAYSSDFTLDEIKACLLKQLKNFISIDFETEEELNAFLDNYNQDTDLSATSITKCLCYGILKYKESIYSLETLNKICEQIKFGLNQPNKDELKLFWNVNENNAYIE
jgi:hypothetical protein